MSPEDVNNLLAVYSAAETFASVCTEAIGMEGSKFTCSEWEAITNLLAHFEPLEMIDELTRMHAIGEDRHGGDCECHDEHHQLWVDEYGPCGECDLTPTKETNDG